jgi:hypothetical protein
MRRMRKPEEIEKAYRAVRGALRRTPKSTTVIAKETKLKPRHASFAIKALVADGTAKKHGAKRYAVYTKA